MEERADVRNDARGGSGSEGEDAACRERLAEHSLVKEKKKKEKIKSVAVRARMLRAGKDF
jgi:hypothetical protein